MPEEFSFNNSTSGGTITFRDRGIRSTLKGGKQRVIAAARITAERSAPDVENYMKTNAPWTDQTSNARTGLTARAFQEGDTVGIELSHSVPYGVFLEVRWSGRYAIIQPSIDAMGPAVMRRFERLLERF